MTNLRKTSRYPFYILGIILVSSCATSKVTNTVKTELRNWRAESENVVNLSILLEDDGTEGYPTLQK